MRSLLTIVLVGCGAADNAVALDPEVLAALRDLSPEGLPSPPEDPTNLFADDPRAAALGHALFFDPLFSGPLLDADNDGSPQGLGRIGDTGRVACSSCHVPDDDYSDTRSFQGQISLGAGWGRRRAPSLLDIGHTKLVMWDGRHDTLWNQVFGPLESVVEMNSSRLYMAHQIFTRYASAYTEIFGELPPLDDTTRFPTLSADETGCVPALPSAPQPTCDGPFRGRPGDQAEFDSMSAPDQDAVTRVVVNVGKALEAYQRLLSCGPSPFDAWMAGDDDAISAEAQRGAVLFVGKAECVRCHAGPFLSDQRFHNTGLNPRMVQQGFIDLNDRGAAGGIAKALVDPLNSRGSYSDADDDRLPSAVTPEMEGAFRTPMLRCASRRPAFMHTGQIASLDDVVAFFNKGGEFGAYPGVSELHPLGLSRTEEAELVAFLHALDGPGARAELRHAP